MQPGGRLKLTTEDDDDLAVEVKPGHYLVARAVTKREQTLARLDPLARRDEIIGVAHLLHQIEEDLALVRAWSPRAL